MTYNLVKYAKTVIQLFTIHHAHAVVTNTMERRLGFEPNPGQILFDNRPNYFLSPDAYIIIPEL